MGAPIGNRNRSTAKPWEEALRKCSVQFEDKDRGIEQGRVLDYLALQTFREAVDGDKVSRGEIASRLDGSVKSNARVEVEHSGAIEHIGLPEIGGRVADLLASRADCDSSALLPH